ncbi:hypothetical protein A3D62_02390 [Candidatus Kaiserbacteria bacterium RIFCSPHIGHO2_02_FULL_49_11]|uniref:Uncharacterized protein n=1 Tax=Candidatus Kaiserbacteria bacterium RIFCSPHIGHO2_02_FULL_49_11 TaxID=1798489 RepID=A0A1F6D037_9BACT|nr:MAG: hypothetical protein A3D62_02390 [Candidatus Kaiserbacteria bacterium RIFCSPHIGHO2_02_FULL_49_11]
MNTLKKETYIKVSGVIFLVVGVLHGVRALNEWNLLISDWSIPVWASWVGLVVGLYLAYTALRLQK